jgi:hypothetical protein
MIGREKGSSEVSHNLEKTHTGGGEGKIRRIRCAYRTLNCAENS